MQKRSLIIIAFAIFTVAAAIHYFSGSPAKQAAIPPDSPLSDTSVELTENQLATVKIQPAVMHTFRVEKEAVGNIAYHENDMGNAHKNSATKFLIANVHESDSPLIHVGQSVEAKMTAYPDRVFKGKVSAVGVTAYDSGGNPAVDPNTHRITVRCEVDDPNNELYPGMLATVVIDVEKPFDSVAIPQNGVTREGDGTMTIWVTTDRKHFEKRTVKVGIRQDGFDQILDGLKPDELVVTDNAVFLSNMNNADSE